MQIYGNILLYREVSETSAPKYYYLYNAHRDVTSLIDSESNVAITYDYDAFGNILSKIGDTDNNITYNGYQYDDETGLYYLNARYYDSTIARFITEDTYGDEKNDPLSLNRYTYFMNNPLVYEDPTGHFSWKKFASTALKVALIAVVTTVVAVAVVASAGTLGAAVASAAIYYGAGAAATGLATAAAVGTYAVAGGVAITGLNRAVEAGTGKNVIADTVFKGNKAAYDKVETAVNMVAFAAVSLGSAYGSNTQSKSKEKNTTTNTSSNTKPKSTTNIASKENTPKLSTSSVKTTNNGKTYQTYTKTNAKTGEVYSGRTSGKGTPAENVAKRDSNHHMNKEGYGPAKLDISSTNKNVIRGREQVLIEKNGGAKSQGGASGNKINGISDKNVNKQKYLDDYRKVYR